MSLLSRLRGETGRALVRTFMARAVSAFGALGLVVVVGQLYGPKGVGVYALAQSILLGSGILARRGMDNALMRFVGRDAQSPMIWHYLYWAGLRSLWIGIPLVLLVVLFRLQIESFFAMPDLANLLIGFGMAIPFYTWSFLLAGFFKGIRRPAAAALQENGAIALVAGGGLGLLSLLYQERYEDPLNLRMLGWVYLAAAIIVSIQGSIQAFLWLRKRPIVKGWMLSSRDIIDFRGASLSFFVMGMASFMQTVLSVVIAAKFLDAIELGLFKSAQQIAISVIFVLTVINAIYPPRFAALYHNGEMGTLSEVARHAALLGLVLASPMLVICLLFPELILSFLGDGFDLAAPLLRIIALAQLVNVATGSVGFLLNMTGHDRVMRNIALICNSLGLLGFLLLTSALGALGTALALAFVLVAQNVVALVLVWTKLGIWTVPGPNLLKLMGVRTQV